jgi:cobalt-precorrin 5A hydrolase
MDVLPVSARIAIGFGATSSARVEDVLCLIEATLSALSKRPDVPASSPSRAMNAVIATLDRRAALARAVGATLGYEVVTFDAATLACVDGVVTASPRVLASVGTASVAESAALAALGSRGRLVAARTTGRNCTCAVAESV